MGKSTLAALCAWLALCMVAASPVATEDRHNRHAIDDESTLVQIDPHSYLMSGEEMAKVKVPCEFCAKTIPVLLELCKATEGRSTDHVDDFLTMCMEIGGLNPEKLTVGAQNCSATELENRRVNLLYERRLRCSKIYSGLLSMYNPYDPCIQIRADYQRHPDTICRSGNIDCFTDAPEVPKNDTLPEYTEPLWTNQTISFHLPPLSCVKYVENAIQQCSTLKFHDYHIKSNLKGWCNNTFYGVYERLGCERVIDRMVHRDLAMDVCSGLKAFPVKDTAEFCVQTLHLNATVPVPVPEYNEYMHAIRAHFKEFQYDRMLSTTKSLGRGEMLYLP